MSHLLTSISKKPKCIKITPFNCGHKQHFAQLKNNNKLVHCIHHHLFNAQYNNDSLSGSLANTNNKIPLIVQCLYLIIPYNKNKICTSKQYNDG